MIVFIDLHPSPAQWLFQSPPAPRYEAASIQEPKAPGFPYGAIKFSRPLREAVKIRHLPRELRVFLECSTRLFQSVTSFQRHLDPVLEGIVFPHLEFPVCGFA